MKEFFKVEVTLKDNNKLVDYFTSWDIAQNYKDFIIEDNSKVQLVIITWYLLKDKKRFTNKHSWTY